METLKNLKKAVGDYQRANKGGEYSPVYGELMLDRKTGELWVDHFCSTGHTSYCVYDGRDVINLGKRMKDAGFSIKMQGVKFFVATGGAEW